MTEKSISSSGITPPARPKRKRQKNDFAPVLIAVVILSAILTAVIVSGNTGTVGTVTAFASIPPSAEDITCFSLSDYPGELPIDVYSTNYIMVDTDSGKLLYERNSCEEVAPASLTKIMTALVAIENIDDLDCEYTFDKSTINYLQSQNASVAGFEEGETVTARDLLYAALLPSGGDGAIGLAMLVGGSIDDFVEMMNEKVDSLGLRHTHFVNPTGLDAEGQYSCAYDICVLFSYALNNEEFRKIDSEFFYTSTPTDEHPDGIEMESTVYAGITKNDITAEYILGGKTGYTDNARLCLATYAEFNGEHYILVTMGAGDGSNKPQYNFFDMDAIYSFCFSDIKDTED